MWTLVALLGVVRLEVAHLGSGVGESFVAVVALVRLLAAVNQLVSLQIARCRKELVAHFAAVPCFPRVALAVQIEQTDLTVALSAGGAAVWLQRT